MISIDDALACIAREVRRSAGEAELELRADVRGVLARDQAGAIDLPPFPQSAMDGYAVRAADLAAAAPDAPVALPVGLEVAAAELAAVPVLAPGHAARIFTGAHIPDGADAVVRQELVGRDGELALFRAPVVAGNDCRARGEEVRAGQTILAAGAVLTAGALGWLAAAGVTSVHVVRSRGLRVICTGSELVSGGSAVGPGQVHDSNGIMLLSYLRALMPHSEVSYATCSDRRDDVVAAMADALDCNELVVTTGGVSVGDHDHVVSVARELGMTEHFWKVDQQPGKPLFFATREGTALLGLPGNPGAVFACMHTYVRLAVERLNGTASELPWRWGRLGSPVQGSERTRLLRCAVAPATGAGPTVLVPLSHQASHMLRSVAACDALVRVPPGPAPAGMELRWVPT